MVQRSYKFRLPDHVADSVRHMHPHLKKKIRAALDVIATEPESGKALRWELSGLRSFRVGRLRIVYQVIDEKEIEIVAIGPRAHIYEETLRLIYNYPEVSADH